MKLAKQQERNIILTIAQINRFPLRIIHNLKKKIDGQKTPTIITQQNKEWVAFSYHSLLIWKRTNLLKHANLKIALCATNTIDQQRTDIVVKTSTNSSRIYKLKFGTCNNSYIVKSGRSISTRHKERTRYIRPNNPISPYALHILNNRQEYSTAEETLELLKSCNKGTKMNCWESFYLPAFHQLNTPLEKQASDINHLYEIHDRLREDGMATLKHIIRWWIKSLIILQWRLTKIFPLSEILKTKHSISEASTGETAHLK